jgi:hypothetical protein
VAVVDPDEDTICRYVVRHYRYDPDRHERRHVVVAAFDNEAEFDACLVATEAALRARRDAGEAVDAREHVSGTVCEPGYRRRQQSGRLLRRAAVHGVWPPNWEDLELPSNVGVVQLGLPDRTRTTVVGIMDEDEAELFARHQREMDEPAPINISKGEAMLLCAALHRYLRHIEQHAAEDNHRTHPREQVQTARRELGRLIWRLEDAAAWPRPVQQHSDDAVLPDQ